jgi:hypothetical protein
MEVRSQFQAKAALPLEESPRHPLDKRHGGAPAGLNTRLLLGSELRYSDLPAHYLFTIQTAMSGFPMSRPYVPLLFVHKTQPLAPMYRSVLGVKVTTILAPTKAVLSVNSLRRTYSIQLTFTHSKILQRQQVNIKCQVTFPPLYNSYLLHAAESFLRS